MRQLLFSHPEWTNRQFASELQRSVSWVKDWKRRLRKADPQDDQVLRGRSTARHHPPERLDERVVDRLLQYRDEPPEELGRTPGPKALRYYLEQDEDLRAQGLRLPRSTNTIHRLLKAAGRIAHTSRRPTQPWPLPEVGTSWQDAAGEPLQIKQPLFREQQTVKYAFEKEEALQARRRSSPD